ncbi:MAG: ABC transporter permease [Actinomycetota bacterium]
MRRIWAITWKEFLHIIRDPRTIISTLVVPPMLVILFGYALTFDVKHIPLAVDDMDKTAASRELIKSFTSSGYFDYYGSVNGFDSANEGFLKGDYKAHIIIPRGFSHNLSAGRRAAIEMSVDGSNPVIANSAYRYALIISQRFTMTVMRKTAPPAVFAAASKPALQVKPQILYNPDLKSINFIVPGLIALILMMIPAIITSVAIVREKETNTIEQLVVSPVRPYELMLGKVSPYLIISGLDALLITLVGILWFKVPFNGSALLLAAMVILYMITTVGIGLLISTVAETQMTAQVGAFLGTMLPAFMLSGFVFPIESMPVVIQYVSLFVPARYFLVALRAIFLKGVGIAAFWQQALILFVFGVIVLTIATLRFRKTMFRYE